MKVTRNTPLQLILEDTPWFIAIMLVFFILAFVGPAVLMMMDGVWEAFFFGFFGGGLGLAAFAVFVRRVMVILDRQENTVAVRRRSLFGYSETAYTLSDLQDAFMESTTSSKGRLLYRPVLRMRGETGIKPLPIIPSYTNGRGPQRLVDAVNDWLEQDHHP